jgi:hypothetical protein
VWLAALCTSQCRVGAPARGKRPYSHQLGTNATAGGAPARPGGTAPPVGERGMHRLGSISVTTLARAKVSAWMGGWLTFVGEGWKEFEVGCVSDIVRDWTRSEGATVRLRGVRYSAVVLGGGLPGALRGRQRRHQRRCRVDLAVVRRLVPHQYPDCGLVSCPSTSSIRSQQMLYCNVDAGRNLRIFRK